MKKLTLILEKQDMIFLPYEMQSPPLATTSCSLSIIIPVYNSEGFLSRCLSSIMNQKTKFDYKVICINDGSTDGSLTILNQFKSEFGDKVIIHNQENKGISKARNQGVKMAKGKYIGFLDNDDNVSPDCVEKITHGYYYQHLGSILVSQNSKIIRRIE